MDTIEIQLRTALRITIEAQLDLMEYIPQNNETVKIIDKLDESNEMFMAAIKQLENTHEPTLA